MYVFKKILATFCLFFICFACHRGTCPDCIQLEEALWELDCKSHGGVIAYGRHRKRMIDRERMHSQSTEPASTPPHHEAEIEEPAGTLGTCRCTKVIEDLYDEATTPPYDGDICPLCRKELCLGQPLLIETKERLIVHKACIDFYLRCPRCRITPPNPAPPAGW